MTKNQYLKLVNEFGLVYDDDTTSAYFNGFPICGYRKGISKYADWKKNCLIIFENYTEQINNFGHYSGVYSGKCANTVKDARQLIANQIVYVKNKHLKKLLENIKKDFR